VKEARQGGGRKPEKELVLIGIKDADRLLPAVKMAFDQGALDARYLHGRIRMNASTLVSFSLREENGVRIFEQK